MVRFTVGRVEEFIHASLSETEEGFVSSAKKSVMANRRGGSELMWKETEKRIGEDWVVELRLCLVVVRAPFMENRFGFRPAILVQSHRPTFPVQLRRSCNSAQALHCHDCGSVHFHGLATLRAAFPWIEAF
ncbi:hypothetical protein LWI29_025841 [Acer saccharum]|uniref:Uncharacterized protein n=1 Tax=Acer saccharum TaxID=4024 RepID=A0AA39V922_ACESA|nr:hypothetical protein LWI29_025841 [Acer saccharum]